MNPTEAFPIRIRIGTVRHHGQREGDDVVARCVGRSAGAHPGGVVGHVSGEGEGGCG